MCHLSSAAIRVRILFGNIIISVRLNVLLLLYYIKAIALVLYRTIVRRTIVLLTLNILQCFNSISFTFKPKLRRLPKLRM